MREQISFKNTSESVATFMVLHVENKILYVVVAYLQKITTLHGIEALSDDRVRGCW
jgi:hypothetical protein